jgi:hypothetical protein
VPRSLCGLLATEFQEKLYIHGSPHSGVEPSLHYRSLGQGKASTMSAEVIAFARRSYKTPRPRRARPGLTVLRRGSASPPIEAECSTGVNARRSLGDRSPTAAIAITNAIDRDGDQVFRQQDRHEQAQGLAVRLKANRYRRFAPCDRCGVPRRSSACRRNRSSISV